MAKKSKITKNEQRMIKAQREFKAGKKPEFSIRIRNRCLRCGRPRGHIRFFKLCRQCARFLIRRGEIAGVRKSSW